MWNPDQERDYAEAVRRFREAAESGSEQLDLSELGALPTIPPEIGGLASLQSLDPSDCEQVEDLAPLAGREREHEEMHQAVTQLSAPDFKLYKAMRDWANHVGDILYHVNDVLAPRGMEDIVKDNCRGFREMLRRKRVAMGPN